MVPRDIADIAHFHFILFNSFFYSKSHTLFNLATSTPFLNLPGQISWPESLSSSGYNSPSVPASPVLSNRSRSFNSASSLSSIGTSVPSKLRLSSSTSYSDHMDECSPGCHQESFHPLANRMQSAPPTPGTDTPTPGALSIVTSSSSAKGFPKDRLKKTVIKLDEKINAKKVETGEIGHVTERKMDPIIQYSGRKV